jgi:hypothetical protein
MRCRCKGMLFTQDSGGYPFHPQRLLMVAFLRLVLPVFFESPKIHDAEADLQDDQGIRLCVGPPNHPQDVAQDEADESCHSSAGAL